MALDTRYSLPYQKIDDAKRCTAPSHFSFPNSRFCVDFYLPQGTPILAARDGIVTEAVSRYNTGNLHEKFRSKCNYIVIEHSDGQESIYAHLAWRSARIKVGQKVKRGQTIGLSGQTGYASYPHLHFGVYNSRGDCIPPIFNESLPLKVSYKRYKLDKEFLICK